MSLNFNSSFSLGEISLWGRNTLSLSDLRAKSKRIHKDNVFISTFTRSFLQLVISSGVTLRVQTKDAKVRDLLKSTWEVFSTDATVSGDMSLDDAIRSYISQIIIDGDVLVYATERKGKLKLNSIQGSRVVAPPDGATVQHFKDKSIIDLSGMFVDQGVVFQAGEVVGYIFIPRGKNQPYQYVPRLNGESFSSILLKSPISTDTDSVRGIPLISSAIKALDDISDLIDSETKSAKIRAKIAAVLKTNSVDPTNAEAMQSFKDNLSKMISEIVKGDASIYVPYPGTELVFNDSTGPGTNNFSLLVKPLLSFVSTLYGVGYDALAHDLKDNTSANARLIYMTAWTDTAIWRNSITSKLLDPFFYLLLESKKISLDGLNWQINCKPYGYVKSSEEIKANQLAMETNQKTLAEVAAESGKDVEDILSENAETEKMKNQVSPNYDFAFSVIDRYKDKPETAKFILQSKGFSEEVINNLI